MKKKVSVIIPVYNAEKYLNECLESIINQTYKEIEVICVNDGSNDKSLEILKEYQDMYPNIKVITQENKGVNGARITGFKNTTGEYIAWVDADDFIESTMYEEMMNIAQENNSDVVICNYNFYPKEVTTKKKWYREFNGEKNWKFISKNTIQWNKIVKKDLLEKINIVELFSTVGEGCYSIALIEAKKIDTLNKCLYNYRVGHTSLSSNFNNINWYKDSVKRSYINSPHMREHDYNKEWIEYFEYAYLYHVLTLMIVASFNGEKAIYYETRKELKEKKIFSEKYKKYLEYNLSKIKIFILKYVFINNYFLSKLIAKIVLR